LIISLIELILSLFKKSQNTKRNEKNQSREKNGQGAKVKKKDQSEIELFRGHTN
jgi:hypothetical protein